MAGLRPLWSGRARGCRRAGQIREFVDPDRCQVWPVVREVVRARETFAYDRDPTGAGAHAQWVEQPPGPTAGDGDGDRVLGTAKLGTNRPGPGTPDAFDQGS